MQKMAEKDCSNSAWLAGAARKRFHVFKLAQPSPSPSKREGVSKRAQNV